MNRTVLINAFVAAALAQTTSVFAADYDSGVVREGPESSYTHVEFGSGWYLRGDIGWNIGGKTETGSQFISAIGDTLEYEYDDNLAIRAGFGYRFNSALRLDFTAEQMLSSEFSGATNVLLNGLVLVVDPVLGPVQIAANDIFGIETVEAEYTAANFMLNAYYDLPQMGKFTPYVGVGAGVSRIHFSERRTLSCIPDPTQTCGAPAVGTQGTRVDDVVILDDEDTVYSLAYQFSLGTAYAINEKLSADVGYSIFGTGGGGELNYSDGTAIDVDGFSTHQVRVGLRYEIW